MTKRKKTDTRTQTVGKQACARNERLCAPSRQPPLLSLSLTQTLNASPKLRLMMMPPTTVALPLKLLLFVLVDGWHLVVRSLVQSFAV